MVSKATERTQRGAKPQQCPRGCKGKLFVLYDELKCLHCGWVEYKANIPKFTPNGYLPHGASSVSLANIRVWRTWVGFQRYKSPRQCIWPTPVRYTRHAIMEALYRAVSTLRLKDIGEVLGREPEGVSSTLITLCRDGMVTKNREGYYITAKGREWYRGVISRDCGNFATQGMYCDNHTAEYREAFGKAPPRWTDMALYEKGDWAYVEYSIIGQYGKSKRADIMGAWLPQGYRIAKKSGVDVLSRKFRKGTGLRTNHITETLTQGAYYYRADDRPRIEYKWEQQQRGGE